jgi:hypothetical protein
MLKRVAACVAAGSLVVLLFVYVLFTSANDTTQPIDYSHKVHIENVGLSCGDCHVYVEKSARASIPGLDICRNCHSEVPLSESPEEKKLLDYIAHGTEIPWKQIYSVPDYVFFSHRRHVVKGELACAVCHGHVAEFTRPVSSMVLPVTMENCMKCHREKKVSNDCLACHR